MATLQTVGGYVCAILCLYYIFATLMATSSPTTSTCTARAGLNVTAWNARGLSTSIAYVTQLLQASDVFVVSEHWLPEQELYKLGHMHPDFCATGKAGDSKHKHSSHCWGGVALLYRREYGTRISEVNVDSNRLCAICIHHANNVDISIIGAYLPQSACKNDNFYDELIVLDELLTRCLSSGEVILMGDLNCHFGSECGPRGWGKTTAHARALHKVLARHGLTIVDLQNKCTGPNFTYHVPGIGKSYIDHCVISETLCKTVIKCNIIDDCIVNTSDHLPVAVSLDIVCCKQRSSIKPENYQVAWHKLNSEQVYAEYTCKVEQVLKRELENLGAPSVEHLNVCNVGGSMNSAECIIHVLIDVMNRCSDSLPKKGFDGRLKPYWNHSLACISKRKKQIFKIWKMAGRPRDESNVIWIEYKKVKTMFRKEQKSAIYQYEIENMKNFAKHAEVDSSFFWYMVNISRNIKNRKATPVKLDNGEVLTDLADINMSWFEYFKDMFSPGQSTHENNKWHNDVAQSVKHHVTTSVARYSYVFDRPFVIDELDQCVKDLKCKKATGCDRVSGEHIKYGGKTLHKCILYVFNEIRRTEMLPDELKRGIIVPLPKGKKDPMIRENNRGITLLPVLNKLYQSMLKLRLDAECDANILEVQGAGRKSISCIHVSFAMRETIAYHREKGKTVYAGFLDVSKAYDGVWTDAMILKLFNTGIDEKFCRIIHNMYINFTCTVRTADRYSEWIAIKQGVQQGAPLSLWLYEMYMNDLLIELQGSGLGADMGDIKVTCPAYADDIALIATHPAKLQCMLDIAMAHSKKWKYKFNAKKSEVFISGKKCNTVFCLGKEEIKQVPACKHLGTIMCKDRKGEEPFVSDCIRRAKQTMSAVAGVGSARVPVSTQVASKLYWSLCAPVLTYGCEVQCMSTEAGRELESAHWAIAKQIQRLPRHTPNPCVLPQLGWFTLTGYMNMKMLVFLWKLLVMEMSSMYKRIVVKRIVMICKNDACNKSGPIANMIKAAEQYNLKQVIVNSIISGTYMSSEQWKTRVKKQIKDYENSQHYVTGMLYKKSSLFFECILNVSVWPWYMHAARYPEQGKMVTSLLRAIVGVNCDDDASYQSVVICKCYRDQRKTLYHVLFECVELVEDRTDLWNGIVEIAPAPFIECLNDMNMMDKTKFFMSGFNSRYVSEMSVVYTAVLTYMTKLLCKQTVM